MTYVPHAALTATKQVHGSVSSARLVTSSNTSGGVRYQMLCNVRTFGLPGNRSLKSTRYFGPLTLSVGDQSRTSPPGFYDDLIQWGLQQNESLSDIIFRLTTQLVGSAVTAQNLGGRWLIR